MEAADSATSPTSSGAALRPIERASVRAATFGFFVALVAAVGAASLSIDPPFELDPYAPPSDWGEWLTQPVQRNGMFALPRYGRVRDVHGSDGPVLWAVGEAGLVLKSEDGGESWNVLSPAPVGDGATAESPDGDVLGWIDPIGTARAAEAPGRDGSMDSPESSDPPDTPSRPKQRARIVRSEESASTEGPRTGSQQIENEGSPVESPRNVEPEPALPSPDSIQTREPFASFPDEVNLDRVEFIDDRTGWVSSYEHVWESRDGGATWNHVFSGEAIDDLSLVSASEGWIVDDGRLFLLKRLEGGWEPVQQDVDGKIEISEIEMASPELGAVRTAVTGDVYVTGARTGSWVLARGVRSTPTAGAGLLWARLGADGLGTLAQPLPDDPKESYPEQVPPESETAFVRVEPGDFEGVVDTLSWEPVAARGWQSARSARIADPQGCIDGAGHAWILAGGRALLRADSLTSRFAAIRTDPAGDWMELDCLPEGGARLVDERLRVVALDGDGEGPRLVHAGGQHDIVSMQLVDPDTAFALTRGERLLRSDDGGASWRAVRLPDHFVPTVAHFANQRLGWVGGPDGIIETRDGGGTWSTGWVSDDPVRWMSSQGQTVLATTGRSLYRRLEQDHWIEQDETVGRISLVTPEIGFAVREPGPIGFTRDGGRSFAELGPANVGERRRDSILDLHALGEDRFVAVRASGGLIWAESQTTGWSWVEAQIPDFTFDARALSFPDPSRGYAVGSDGLVYELDAEPASVEWPPRSDRWRRVAQFDAGGLSSVSFASADVGIAGGANGFVAYTTDGAETWQTAEPGFRWPAPWASVVLVVLGVVGLALYLVPQPPEPDSRSIDPRVDSDQPIRDERDDVLGFQPIAESLAKLLRNAGTRPPFTIAVTGPWGSGKTSLMQLLRQNLRRERFEPVWFNAWHHQKGEQLLAELFANIRDQAIPPLLSLRGVLFRVRLLRRRSALRMVVAASLAFVLVVSVTYVAIHANLLVGALLESPDLLRSLVTGQESDVSNKEQDVLIALLVSGASSVFGWLPLRAFGISPKQLTTTVTDTFRPMQMNVNPGARARFAREFADVSMALRPRTLTIFIDDLDRCSQEVVVEVLEMLNFLVSSGECFVVIGMDPEWVETCIDLAFSSIDERLGKRNDRRLAAGESVERSEPFAARYLDKMINLRVRVRKPSSPEIGRLLAAQNGDTGETNRGSIWRAASARARSAAPGLAAAAGLIAAVAVGANLPAARNGTDAARDERAAAEPATSETRFAKVITHDLDGDGGAPAIYLQIGLVEPRDTATPAADPADGGPAAVTPLADRADDTSAGIPPSEDDESPSPSPFIYFPSYLTRLDPAPLREPVAASGWLYALAIGPFVVLGVLVLAMLLRRQEAKVVEHDSEAFTDALRLWQPWIVAANPTPRSIKGFTNFVRYLAIRRGVRAAGISHGQVEDGDQKKLVAMSAIHHLDPGRLEDDDRFSELQRGELGSMLADLRQRERLDPESDDEGIAALLAMPLERDAALLRSISAADRHAFRSALGEVDAPGIDEERPNEEGRTSEPQA